MSRPRPPLLVLGLATAALLAATAAPVVAQPRESASVAQPRESASVAQPRESASVAQPRESAPELPLGPSGLPQTSTVQQLAPGLTFTEIVRGSPDATTPWVVELSIPAVDDPDPDAPAQAVQDQASAEALVAELAAAGLPAEAQPVVQPETADLAGGVIGYRVRLVETFADRDAARTAVATVQQQGFSARDWYRGWDGGSTDPGQWTVQLITVDPEEFEGELGASYGPDLLERETVSELAAATGATAAVNGGFFVLAPAAGAPGDPAGAAVYDGRLLSEPVGDRPVLVLDEAGRAQVARPTWRGSVTVAGRARPAEHAPRALGLDGLNRDPGLIRNCGGTGDVPTDLALHDVTCTDPDELVAFTPEFGPSTPAGPGREVVLDTAGRVLQVQASRGVVLQPGQRSLQATGDRVAELDVAGPGTRLGIRTTLSVGSRSLARPGTSVVNGGPELRRRGVEHVTQAGDGMSRADDPSFAYGWALQRNPRTLAGVDEQGRTVLVTVDGRQPDQLGLSIDEAADLAGALGLREAINLDGGGSTATVVAGELVSSPSDAAGERPVGDAIYVR